MIKYGKVFVDICEGEALDKVGKEWGLQRIYSWDHSLCQEVIETDAAFRERIDIVLGRIHPINYPCNSGNIGKVGQVLCLVNGYMTWVDPVIGDVCYDYNDATPYIIGPNYWDKTGVIPVRDIDTNNSLEKEMAAIRKQTYDFLGIPKVGVDWADLTSVSGPTGDVSATDESCKHSWKEYKGFTANYNYCIFCDEKRS
jgi:hypothetical protein